VPRDAKLSLIKKNFRKIAMKYHPDKAPLGKEESYNAIFQKYNEAFQVLSEPNERAWYD